jgi:hypothetical protein
MYEAYETKMVVLGKTYTDKFSLPEWVVPDFCAKQTVGDAALFYVVDIKNRQMRWVKIVDGDREWNTCAEDWSDYTDTIYVPPEKNSIDHTEI